MAIDLPIEIHKSNLKETYIQILLDLETKSDDLELMKEYGKAWQSMIYSIQTRVASIWP